MSASETIYQLKRGATLSLAGTKLFPAGTWSGTAKVRKSDYTAVDTITVVVTPPVAPATDHTILVVATSVQTAAWPLEKLKCDIRFADASDPPVVLPTSTFVIDVVREITDA